MLYPPLETLPEYYQNYIRESDSVTLSKNHLEGFITWLKPLKDEAWDYAYAPGKWRIRDLIQHVLDSERIFSYRVLCISRGDRTPLPYFDEETYSANAKNLNRKPEDLLEELRVLGEASRLLLRSMGPEQFAAMGISNSIEMSAETLVRIMMGHAAHHERILRERYQEAQKDS